MTLYDALSILSVQRLPSDKRMSHLPIKGTFRPMELGIMYSHTCNIECRHCGILSSPKNQNRMSLDFAERCIREAAALAPLISTIVFTGGEPFLFLVELESMLSLCTELGLSTRVVTNGFWARNASQGKAILHRLRLAGLDTINFSGDKYHLEFMDAFILRNAIEAAQEVGFAVIVNFVTNERGDPVEQFASMYDIPKERVRLFEEEEFAHLMTEGSIPSDFLTKIHLSCGRLIGLGRCAQYPEEHFYSPIEAFPVKPCLEVVNRPVIYPEGDLQACCCAGGKIEAFTVGNLHSTSLSKLIDQMSQRTHYRFINTFGPRLLYETMRAATPTRAWNDLHASICDTCVAATTGCDAEKTDRILEHWLVNRLMSS